MLGEYSCSILNPRHLTLYIIYIDVRMKQTTNPKTPWVGRPPQERPINWASLIVQPITTKCDLVGSILLGFGLSNEPKVHLSRLATSNDDPKE